MAWSQHYAEEWDQIQNDATDGGRLLRVGRWDRSALVRRDTVGGGAGPGGGCGSSGRNSAETLAWHMRPLLLVTAKAAAEVVEAVAAALPTGRAAHSFQRTWKVFTALLSQARPLTPASPACERRTCLRRRKQRLTAFCEAVKVAPGRDSMW